MADMASGTLSSLGMGTYDSGSGVYTDVGTADEVSADLQTLVFTPTLGVPGTPVTTTFTINDIDSGSASADAVTTYVVATAGLNMTPVTPGFIVPSQTSVMPFAGVTITDIPDETDTVTVTLSNTANGSLSTIGTGTYDDTTGIYSDTGSAAAVTADLQGLMFTPTIGTPGVGVTTGFIISDIDTTSTLTATGTTSVIAIAGPAISDTMASQLTSDQVTINPFLGVTVADDISQTETLMITLSDTANGSLSNVGGGSYDEATGVYSDTGLASDVTADLQGLMFTPTIGTAGVGVTTGFTISDIDTTSTLTATGTTSVISIAGPAIGGTMTNQLTSDQLTINPFLGVAVADDISQTETLMITLSNTANGSLSNVGGGSYDEATGIYSDTGLASDVTTDLQGLVFTPTVGTPGVGVTTGFTISDIDTTSTLIATGTTSVIAIAGPAISGTTLDQLTSDLLTINPFFGVTVADDISQTETLMITLSDTANGSLSTIGTGTYDDTTGIYSDTGFASDVTADLQGLMFTPTIGTPGVGVTTGFTISDIDTTSTLIATGTTSVIAIAGPAIGGTTPNQLTSDQLTINPFLGVMVADDISQTETLMITLSDTANGSLSNVGGGSYDEATGVYSDTGLASDVTADLQGLMFTPTVGTAGVGVTTGFTISDIDTTSTLAATGTTSVIAIAGPAIGGTTPNQLTSDQLTINPFLGVMVTDDISQTETLMITLSDTANGSLSNVGGGSYDEATGVYSDTGLASDITADLQGLMFTPTIGTTGVGVTTGFTISDIDTASTLTASGTTSVIAIAGPAISGTTIHLPISNYATINPFATVVIADDISQTETLMITLSDTANGSLGNLGGGSYDDLTGLYSDTGLAADVTADLRGLVFIPTIGAFGVQVTTDFTISDTDTTSPTTASDTTSVIVIPGPAISGTMASQLTSDHVTINPFATVVIADEINQTETLMITLSDTANGSLTPIGSGTYDDATGIYSDIGPAADVTADLQGLMFTPTIGTAGVGVTTGFSISDIDANSPITASGTISVIAIAGPAINGTMASQLTSDQVTINPFFGVTVADNISQTETLMITLSNTVNGSLSNLGGGSYDEATGLYSDTGLASDVTADLQGLMFTPTIGTAGVGVTTGFAISDIDTTSTLTATGTTSVIAIAGPAISGTMANQMVTNQGTIMPFANVMVADDISQTETLTITLSNTANGSLTPIGSGTYDDATGIYSDIGPAADVTADLQGLMFTPTIGTPGVGATTGFTISDFDTTSTLTATGTTSVIAIAGPAISGTTLNQLTSDQLTINPFLGVAVADDISQTETLMITLSNTANGSLSNLGGGSYDEATGVYSDTGLASDVTADLQGLMFTPTIGTLGVGVTTGFTITDIDTTSTLAATGTTSVIAIAGPVISGTTLNQLTSDQLTINPFFGVTVADDISQTETLMITLSNTANGSLSNLGGGSYDEATGVYSDTGLASNVTADLQGLMFTPTIGTAGVGATTGFTITDIDTTNTLTATGTTSVIAIAGPAISGTMASQMVTNQGTIMPFANVMIADDISQTETVTVTLSAAANGSLSNLGSNGHYIDGVYTDTGSAGQVTSDLHGLVFTPATGAPGHSVTTGFGISVTDTAGLSAEDPTTSVLAKSTDAPNDFHGQGTSDVLFKHEFRSVPELANLGWQLCGEPCNCWRIRRLAGGWHRPFPWHQHLGHPVSEQHFRFGARLAVVRRRICRRNADCRCRDGLERDWNRRLLRKWHLGHLVPARSLRSGARLADVEWRICRLPRDRRGRVRLDVHRDRRLQRGRHIRYPVPEHHKWTGAGLGDVQRKLCRRAPDRRREPGLESGRHRRLHRQRHVRYIVPEYQFRCVAILGDSQQCLCKQRFDRNLEDRRERCQHWRL